LWGDRLLASCAYRDEMRHAERLFDTVDQVLADARWPRRLVAAIACDVGPGSFTGLRVGVASAKGMALALGVPVVPVGSLEAMAAAALAGLDGNVAQVVCVVDAKRRENFYAVYDRQLNPRLGPVHVAAADTQAALGALVDDPATGFCGLPARELGVPAGRLVDDPACVLPHAEWVARRAAAVWQEPVPPLAAIEPVYLRAPDAVPNLPKPLIGSS